MHLQTQQQAKIGLIKMGIKVLKSDGIFGLYNGLTASLLRQVICQVTRVLLQRIIVVASHCSLCAADDALLMSLLLIIH